MTDDPKEMRAGFKGMKSRPPLSLDVLVAATQESARRLGIVVPAVDLPAVAGGPAAATGEPMELAPPQDGADEGHRETIAAKGRRKPEMISTGRTRRVPIAEDIFWEMSAQAAAQRAPVKGLIETALTEWLRRKGRTLNP